MGVLIANGEFVWFRGTHPTTVRVATALSGTVRFVNYPAGHRTSRLQSLRAAALWAFRVAPSCSEIKTARAGQPIQARGGTVLVRRHAFHDDSPQAAFGGGVRRAVMTDDKVATGEVRIVNRASGAV
jgi:hypothetical protein